MHVLIVESRPELSRLWQRHLDRLGIHTLAATTQDEATEILSAQKVDVIILDVVLWQGSALAVCDYAAFRQPEARVLFVTSSTFFSDGSIFGHADNVRAFLPAATAPEDLAAMVEHYGRETA
ncbi:MAG: response regulator [Sulfitobacter sp.]|nr:response regulator [Sulfitobacter sp.]